MIQSLLSVLIYIYPFYITSKSIEEGENSVDLTIVWLLYGTIMCIFDIFDDILSWVPLIWILKYAILAWVVYPKTSGGRYLYKTILRTWWHHDKWLKSKNYTKELKDMNETECRLFDKSQRTIVMVTNIMGKFKKYILSQNVISNITSWVLRSALKRKS